MGGWGCQYESGNDCILLKKECDPGLKGCVLYGKVTVAQKPKHVAPKREELHKGINKKNTKNN